MSKEKDYPDEDYETEEEQEYDSEPETALVNGTNGTNGPQELTDEVSKDLKDLFSGNENWEPQYSGQDMFAQDSNMIKVQIDTEKILMEIARFYRGDRKIVKNNRIEWVEATKKDRLLNDYGYSKMMEINTKYLNANTLLSYYGERRIYLILGRLGQELRKFILLNYKKIGLDTKDKEEQYTLLVLTTLHMIESGYRRAINAKTFESLNQSRLGGGYNQSPRQPTLEGIPKRGFLRRITGL